MSSLVSAMGDGVIVARRNVIKIRRVPELLVFSTLSPIMFILLFAYVFGSAIQVPGVSYREFLMAGIFVQTVIFGSTITGVALAEDLRRGIIDRFRSLPMSRSAVLVGRTGSDIVNNLLVICVMSGTALIVGWRIRTSVLDAVTAYVLLLLFAYSISWVMAFLGLVVGEPEVVNTATFIITFPVTFIANTFVPSENLPTVLKTIAEWNPVSAVAKACRELFGNVSSITPPADVWSLQHPVAYTLIWVAAILVVFVPLSVWQYQRAALR